MDILNIDFDSTFSLNINGQDVSFILYQTPEHGNVKFGINAPRNLPINREEIYRILKKPHE